MSVTVARSDGFPCRSALGNALCLFLYKDTCQKLRRIAIRFHSYSVLKMGCPVPLAHAGEVCIMPDFVLTLLAQLDG
jgi:hypothetical protein